jgi:hypothetical protein
MIRSENSNSLAELLLIDGRNVCGKRLSFLVDPGLMTAMRVLTPETPAPLLTTHGGSQELGELIHTYHQWGQQILVEVFCTDGISRFWVGDTEND